MIFAPACIALLMPAHRLVEVPFRIAENAIVVDVKVNGTPASLMFDTGFGGTVLMSSSVDIGPASGKMRLRDFVGEMDAKTVKLKSLQVGSESIDPDDKTVVQQEGDFSAAYGQHVDGILGLGALKNRVVEINYEKSEFIFHADSDDISKRVPDGKKTFMAKMLPIGGNSIELEVTTPQKQVMTLSLDSGNAFFATTHRDVLERVGLWDSSKKARFTRLSGVASGPVESWMLKMPPLTIFGVPVQSTIWDIIDLPSSSAEGDGTVGFGFLSNFNVTFDYARRRVWLENWRTPIENQEKGDIGVSAHFDRQQKRTVVSLVSPGSPAEAAGLKEGDEILSIGDTDLVHPIYKELRAMLEGPVGSQVKIAVSRDGALKRFSIKRASLINE